MPLASGQTCFSKAGATTEEAAKAQVDAQGKFANDQQKWPHILPSMYVQHLC
jgi:hypothetical protein